MSTADSPAVYVQAYNRTAVKTAAYTALLWDLVACSTAAGGFTLTLPPAAQGRGSIAVKLTAAGGTLNIAATGTDRFNTTGGPAASSLTLLNQSLIAESDGVGVWTLTATSDAAGTRTYATRSYSIATWR